MALAISKSSAERPSNDTLYARHVGPSEQPSQQSPNVSPIDPSSKSERDALAERLVPTTADITKEIFAQVHEALSAGRLTPATVPDSFLEAERIVDPLSSQGRAFQGAMEELTKRLAPELDLTTRAITFLISDKREQNAYILPTPAQSIICFDLEMLKSLGNLNQLSWVLLHELTHLGFRDKFGNIHNSQVEEGICDLRPLMKMYDAGLQITEAETFTIKMADKKVPSWMSIVDAHALPHYRLDSVQNGIVALRQARGNIAEAAAIPQSIEPLPEELRLDSSLKGARHESFIDKTFGALDFNEKTPTQQLQIIASLHSDLDPIFFHRAKDLAKKIQSIDIDPKDKEQIAPMKRFADDLLEKPAAFNSLYPAIQDLCGRDGKIRYLSPRLIKVSKAAQAFIESEELSKGEAEQSAQRLIATLDALPAWQSIDWSSVNIPHFEFAGIREYRKALREFRESGEDVIMPWDSLATMVAPSNQIGKALVYMGAFDERIPLKVSERDLHSIQEHIDICYHKSRPERHQYSAKISTPRDEDGELHLNCFQTDGNGLVVRLSEPSGSLEMSALKTFIDKIRPEAHRRKLEHETERATSAVSSQSPASTRAADTLTFLSLPHAQFMQAPHTHLQVNAPLLIPTRSSIGDHVSQSEINREFKWILTTSLTSSSQLLSYFGGMLRVTEEPALNQHSQFIRDFFLEATQRVDSANPSGTINFATVVHNKEDNGAGMSTTQAYDKWIAEDPHKLFSLAEKGVLLSHVDVETGITLFRKTVQVTEPHSISQLLAVLDRYKGLGVSNMLSVGSQASQLELELFLEKSQHNEPLHPLFSQHGNILGQLHTSQAYKSILFKYVKAEKNWPTDSESLVNIYRTITSLSLFPSEEWRGAFKDKMFKSISELPHDEARLNMLELLLLDPPPKDVDVREAAISKWVQSVARIYGQDNTPHWNDKTSPYVEAIRPLISRIGEKGHLSVREPLLRTLADTVLSQNQLSRILEQAASGPIDEKKIASSGFMLGVSQSALDMLSKSSDRRMKTVRFLTSSLTKSDLKTYAQEVGIDIFMTLESLASSSYDSITPFDRTYIQMECKRFHDNFWRAPMPLRTALLKELLMPAQDRMDELKAGRTDSFDTACELVINELIPLQDTHNIPNKYAPEGRTFLRAFLAPGVLDERQRPLFISAMMAAVQRSNEQGVDFSVGQRLATILEGMGPAWKKFGQAISSHPNTPPDIARDMEPLKGNSTIPRWELWALFNQNVPEILRNEIPKLGKVLESASFFTAVTAGTSVFTLLTPHAQARADDGFAIMESFVRELQKAHYGFQENAYAVAEMVQSARTSAILETNARVGAAQAQAMDKLYAGLTVTTLGQTFLFSTGAWSQHGPEFRHMTKMPGPTFNDLPTSTEQNTLQKRATAKAVLAVELKNILCGGAFDPDRHGRNFRVDGDVVGHFDHGAVHAVVRDRNGTAVHPLKAEAALVKGGSIEIPLATKAELEQLAQALFSSFKGISQGKSLAVVMHDEIERARADSGETPEYLIRVERALLALNDCFKCLDSEGQDIKDILGSLYLDGHINPTLTASLEKKIMSEKLGAFGALLGGKKFVATYLKKEIKDHIHLEQAPFSKAPESTWFEHRRNRQDYPTLLTVEDLVVKKGER